MLYVKKERKCFMHDIFYIGWYSFKKLAWETVINNLEGNQKLLKHDLLFLAFSQKHIFISII